MYYTIKRSKINSFQTQILNFLIIVLMKKKEWYIIIVCKIVYKKSGGRYGKNTQY